LVSWWLRGENRPKALVAIKSKYVYKAGRNPYHEPFPGAGARSTDRGIRRGGGYASRPRFAGRGRRRVRRRGRLPHHLPPLSLGHPARPPALPAVLGGLRLMPDPARFAPVESKNSSCPPVPPNRSRHCTAPSRPPIRSSADGIGWRCPSPGDSVPRYGGQHPLPAHGIPRFDRKSRPNPMLP
jgi:hypothetical protein